MSPCHQFWSHTGLCLPWGLVQVQTLLPQGWAGAWELPSPTPPPGVVEAAALGQALGREGSAQPHRQAWWHSVLWPPPLAQKAPDSSLQSSSCLWPSRSCHWGPGFRPHCPPLLGEPFPLRVMALPCTGHIQPGSEPRPSRGHWPPCGEGWAATRLGGRPSRLLPPTARFISGLWGAFTVGLWGVGVSRARGWGFMWMLSTIALEKGFVFN